MSVLAEASKETSKFHVALSRRALQEGFWNIELHLEILDQKMEYRFYKPEDREACMIEIERRRRQQIYTHECYQGCKNRGEK